MLARGRSSIALLTVASPLLGQALADRMVLVAFGACDQGLPASRKLLSIGCSRRTELQGLWDRVSQAAPHPRGLPLGGHRCSGNYPLRRLDNSLTGPTGHWAPS